MDAINSWRFICTTKVETPVIGGDPNTPGGYTEQNVNKSPTIGGRIRRKGQ